MLYRNLDKEKSESEDPTKFISREATKTPTKMSDMQVAVADKNAVALSKDAEFESECTEETTLSEVSGSFFTQSTHFEPE